MVRMRSVASRAASPFAIFVVGLLAAGCVPYQKYDLAMRELEEAKKLNDDLVRKYHQELMKSKSGAVPTAGFAPAALRDGDAAEIQRLIAENRALQQKIDDLNLRFDKEDEAYLRRQAEGVTVAEDGSLVLISDLLFPSGVAKLKAAHMPALDSVANLLKTRYPNERIIIEGHTDDEPLKSTKTLFEHNWNLGYERASSVFDYFRKQHGLHEQQMVLVTYGYTQPVVEGSTPEARRQNRRVVIRRGGRVSGTLASN